MDGQERIVVGVNKFINENEKVEIPTLDIGLESGRDQVKKIKALKESRDNSKVNHSLEKIKKFCKSKQNLVPVIIDAAKNDVTMGEIVEAMKSADFIASTISPMVTSFLAASIITGTRFCLLLQNFFIFSRE